MAKSCGINFATTENLRNGFNSTIAAHGLKTKDVLNAFVELVISNPDATLKFIGIK